MLLHDNAFAAFSHFSAFGAARKKGRCRERISITESLGGFS